MNQSAFSTYLTTNDTVKTTTTHATTKFKPLEIILSNVGRRISEIVMDLVFSFIIANMGIVSNTLVIVVFFKQGFKESVNISMTAISIWDLIKCIAASMQRMSGPISAFSEADAESWTNICIVAFNYLICFSTYVTSVLAAYVAVERCLCVCVPFKVKWLLTPKVTFSVCTFISVFVFGWFAVLFGIYDIVWVMSDMYNKSIAIYRNNDFYYANQVPLFEYYNLSGILWPLVSFAVIVVCTIIIAYKLKESSRFRLGQAEVKAETANQLSNRDRQVIKMLMVIIGVYVVGLSPRIGLYLAKYLIYDFYFLRRLHNIFVFVSYVLWIFDLSNGAVNFFVFYTMSSSFKTTFFKMFRKAKLAKTKPDIRSNQPKPSTSESG